MTAVAIEEKAPMWVHCGDCSYEWIAVFVPAPMSVVANLLKAAACPFCWHKSILMGKTPKPTPEGDADAWIVNGDTGTSSKTIWSVMRGVTPKRACIPADAGEFGRCYRLLKVMPSWRPRLGELAKVYPEWAPLVDAWEELTTLYEAELPNQWFPNTYNRMRELRGEARLDIPATRPVEKPRARRRR